jgi:hypothetical protein
MGVLFKYGIFPKFNDAVPIIGCDILVLAEPILKDSK